MNKIQISHAKNALRRAWLTWPPRNECRKNARISRGRYQCAECRGLFGPKSIEVDHINPVSSFTDFDTFIERLLCPIENLQVLCKADHKAKSAREATARKLI